MTKPGPAGARPPPLPPQDNPGDWLVAEYVVIERRAPNGPARLTVQGLAELFVPLVFGASPPGSGDTPAPPAPGQPRRFAVRVLHAGNGGRLMRVDEWNGRRHDVLGFPTTSTIETVGESSAEDATWADDVSDLLGLLDPSHDSAPEGRRRG